MEPGFDVALVGVLATEGDFAGGLVEEGLVEIAAGRVVGFLAPAVFAGAVEGVSLATSFGFSVLTLPFTGVWAGVDFGTFVGDFGAGSIGFVAVAIDFAAGSTGNGAATGATGFTWSTFLAGLTLRLGKTEPASLAGLGLRLSETAPASLTGLALRLPKRDPASLAGLTLRLSKTEASSSAAGLVTGG